MYTDLQHSHASIHFYAHLQSSIRYPMLSPPSGGSYGTITTIVNQTFYLHFAYE